MCSRFLSVFATLALAAHIGMVSAEARTLRVCADPNNMPFSNDRLEGFENAIVSLIAEHLDASVEYVWRAHRRGFLRETLKADACDLVPGLPARMDGITMASAYYRSSYVFVTREDVPPIASFDDTILKQLKVGVQLVGDDGWNTPPAHALAERHIIENVRGFHLYADYSLPDPPARIIEAVAAGDIDVAVVWGPLAGYFAQRQPVPLRMTPVEPALSDLPMSFVIGVAVQRGDWDLGREIATVMREHHEVVEAILDRYGVPRITHRTLVRRDTPREGP